MNRDVWGQSPTAATQLKLIAALTRGLVLGTVLGMSGCSLLPEPEAKRDCSELATVQLPPVQQQRFPLIITKVNGEPVARLSTIRLAPGSYQLTLVEQIEDPRFARTNSESQSMQLELAAGVRYHLAAKLVLEQGNSRWYPEVWRTGEAVCPASD